MDEPQYLHVAHSVIEGHVLFPQAVSWTFFGKVYPTMFSQTHLPVVEYYLAALMKVTGGVHPRLFRFGFVVFPILTLLSFYELARRFTANPLLVSALFAVSPAFFVLSPTLMMDIPMLGFLLAGLVLYFDSVDTGRPAWGSAVFFVLAAGTGYVVLVPLACLLAWSLMKKHSAYQWSATAAAPISIVVWFVIIKHYFGSGPSRELIGYYTSHFSLSHLVLPLLSFLGGVSLFPGIYIVLIERPKRLGILVASTIAAGGLTMFRAWPSVAYRLWFIALASCGIALLILFVVHSVRRLKTPTVEGLGFLVLWLLATLLFYLCFADMIAARYLLLALPPLFLILFDHIPPQAATAAVALTLGLSISIGFADQQWVNQYPRWVQQALIPMQQEGFRVWNASEVGLRFYLESNGVQTLNASDLRPQGGELIVRQTSSRYGLSPDLEPLLLPIAKFELSDRFPVRTSSLEAGAGFHDSHWGLVPYAISRAPFDQVEIAEVSPFVTTLPEKVPEDFSSTPLWFPGGVLLKQVKPEMTFPVRVPLSAKFDCDVEGAGSADVSASGILIKRLDSKPVLWKNCKFVP